MDFAYPQYLWLLAGLPVFAGLLWLGYCVRKYASESFRSEKFRKKAGEKTSSVLGEIANGGVLLLAAALMIVAVAGPYQKDKPVRVPEGPVQACFVVDVSRSMAAEDYRDHMPADAGQRPDLDSPWGNRLQMAKYQIEKVMQALPGNQLCLVTYTEHGFPQAVLGDDFNALRFVLKHWVNIGTAPGDGSNYADGMQVAMDILTGKPRALASENERSTHGLDPTLISGGNGSLGTASGETRSGTTVKASDSPRQKVIILLTDGGFTGGANDVSEAVKRLAAEKVKLVIVGIGMPGENAIPLYAEGVRKGQMEKEGKPLTTSYEEDAIRNLKSQTDAGYTHIALDAQSQVVTVDWMTEISGSKLVFEKRMLDRYLAGAAYALISITVMTGFFTRRRKFF